MYRQAPSTSFVAVRPPPSVVHTLQMSSPQKTLGKSKPWAGRNESLFATRGLSDQDERHMAKYGKNNLKNFFSGTKGPMALGLNMQNCTHGINKV